MLLFTFSNVSISCCDRESVPQGNSSTDSFPYSLAVLEYTVFHAWIFLMISDCLKGSIPK